ncbi:PFU-domain-containing protein [Aulographum hederae CBS 113979]|uniref:PFU-domain-containing protein n=1 Tax=Aulographum hederae CBS 113979 TaxID=1176131 RepID=A0A6G1H6U5_9PEZI|nr:PFU-domain-containing protein [Aulographum hederae CBS 113979]
MGDAPYKLSVALKGHEDDVRVVLHPNPSFVASGSRDASVRLWKLESSRPPAYDCTLVSHGSTFVNSLAYVPSSSRYPDGLIISGGVDSIIEARQPGRNPDENAEALLLGHGNNICALDASDDGRTIVSGSWDHSARIWQVGDWEKFVPLNGHNGNVWAVLAYDKETVITGCADKLIRLFQPRGKLLREIPAGDVVRALCRLPPGNPYGAHFASAANDSIIRLWTLDGTEVAQLHGHTNFIYSLAALPSGEVVSCGEDRTLRIWKGFDCIQTITHPATSVWSVSVCAENGDIVSGSSDNTARVFSRAPERQADEAAIKQFEEEVASHAVPKQALDQPNINPEQLSGPEFLQQKQGAKDGAQKMIRENNGDINLYTWSMSEQRWVKVGLVVGSAGSSREKQDYMGKDYDYVFEINMEDGQPNLKLPYNVGQNPHEVAQKFLNDNELPISYVDQIVNFIVTNTQGATIGQDSAPQSQAPGSDPWGTGSRYRPGEGDPISPQQDAAASRPKILPQTTYLSITTGNLAGLQKKLLQFNDELVEDRRKDISLNPHDIEVFNATIKQLELATKNPSSAKPALNEGIDIALRMATQWPLDKRLPGLDLLRLLVALSPATITHTSSGSSTIVDALAASDVFTPDAPPNSSMMAIRIFANLFATEASRLIADGEFEKIHALIHPFVESPDRQKGNRNLTIAITTLYINYSVLFAATPDSSADRSLTLLDDLTKLLNSVADSEALYRALVGAGTLLTLGEDFRTAAKEVFDLETALGRAAGASPEPRIRNVVAEIRDELA